MNKNKIFTILYYMSLVVLIVLFTAQFFLFQSEKLDEYQRCYFCINSTGEPLICDCEDIPVEEEKAVPWWYVTVIGLIGLYVVIYISQFTKKDD